MFLTIPKAWGFEDATCYKSTLMGGSLIPIVVIGMGMVLTWLNTYPAKAGIHYCASGFRLKAGITLFIPNLFDS